MCPVLWVGRVFPCKFYTPRIVFDVCGGGALIWPAEALPNFRFNASPNSDTDVELSPSRACGVP